MLKNVLNSFSNNIVNVPGWRTNRKIIVIESDDWGSIRMPSRSIYNQLEKDGFQLDTDPYLKYDSLASVNDLTALFEVLSSVKDKNGNPAIITANCVVANPDFKKIRDSGFCEYYYEPFTETLKRYPNHDRSFQLWMQGLDAHLFYPQFHGREHLNVDRWLKGLREGDKVLHKAFNHEMISISSVPSTMRFGYMEALDFFTDDEKTSKSLILSDGLHLFEKYFGFKSESFIANCYIWHKDFEKELYENGVRFIQGIPFQFQPKLELTGRHHFDRILHYTGQKNRFNQIFLVRNVHFEPSLSSSKGLINNCLKRIEIAFRWSKPAIISSHRLNFIGSVIPENATQNLTLLRHLLSEIVSRWSDVEFMSSSDLGNLIIKNMN